MQGDKVRGLKSSGANKVCIVIVCLLFKYYVVFRPCIELYVEKLFAYGIFSLPVYRISKKSKKISLERKPQQFYY